MLKIMRKYQRSWIIKIIFGAIIVSFVLFFGYSTWTEKEKPVARIGKYKVEIREYHDAYRKAEEMSRMIFRDQWDEKLLKDLNLQDKVLGQIVNSYLLMVAADELGIKIGDDEFADFLTSVEAFKKDGKFSKEQYQAVLRGNNLDSEQFENVRKKEMLVQKVAGVIQDTGTFFDEAEAWKAYVKEKGKVKLTYALFDPSSFEEKVQVNEKELLDTYERQKSLYRGENSYRLKLLIVNRNDPIKDDAVYMDLLRIKDIDTYGKDKGLSVSTLNEMSESELVKQYKGLRVEDLREMKKKGEISRLIRSAEGQSYIFQLVEMTEGKDLDKTAAVAKIKEKVVHERAKVLARNAAEEAIKSKNIPVEKETGFVSRTAPVINGIGQVPADSLALLEVTKEKPIYDKPVEIAGRFYVFSFKTEELPDKQIWEKEKEAYTRYFAAKSREEYLDAYLSDMKSRVKVTLDKRQLL